MEAIVLIILAYLLGSLPTAVWLGKALRRVDVREHGSGNAGATNTIRVLGTGIGITVLLIDMFKGWLAVYTLTLFPSLTAGFDHPDILRIFLALAAVLGHVFPIFAGFRGGKGVATFLGTALGIFPLTFLSAIGVFLLVFIPSRYVSLGSILSALTMPVFAFWVFHEPLPSIIYALIVAIVIPLTHKQNIQRLLKGEEKRLSFSKKGKT